MNGIVGHFGYAQCPHSAELLFSKHGFFYHSVWNGT